MSILEFMFCSTCILKMIFFCTYVLSSILKYYYYLKVSSPTIIVERAGSSAWTHKSWRVREEFIRTVTSAINLFSATELPLQRAILPPVLTFLNMQRLSLYS
jgi:hypothetical protein